MRQTAALPLAIWGWSDRGRKRTANEDRVLPCGAWPVPFQAPPEAVAARGYLLAVADGVSTAGLGAAAGEVVLAALHKQYYASTAPGPAAALAEAISAANTAAWHMTQRASGNILAATTLVTAVVYAGTAWVAHAGDSRGYLITPERTEPLTTDHSVVQELLAAGVIDAQEACEHPQQGVITRALGIGEQVVADFAAPVALESDDRLLLCSDGLTTLVEEAEIGAIVRRKPPRAAVTALIALANRRGGHDNISAVVAGRAGHAWWRGRWR